jgi:hypothetical protein
MAAAMRHIICSLSVLLLYMLDNSSNSLLAILTDLVYEAFIVSYKREAFEFIFPFIIFHYYIPTFIYFLSCLYLLFICDIIWQFRKVIGFSKFVNFSSIIVLIHYYT